MKQTTNDTNGNSGGNSGGNAWDRKELGVFLGKENKKTGEKYLTGIINLKALGFDKDVPVVVFTNKNKQKDSHPDLRVYLSEKPTPTAAAQPVATPSVIPQTPKPSNKELI